MRALHMRIRERFAPPNTNWKRGWRRLVAAIVSVAMVTGLSLLAASPASAATAISGNPGSDGVGQAWLFNGKLYYCVSPGSGNPVGSNNDMGLQGFGGLTGNNPIAPSAFFASAPDDHTAGLSWLTDQGQDPSNNARVVAVSMAVKYLYNSDALYVEFTSKLGYSGANDLAAMARWVQGSYSTNTANGKSTAQDAVDLYNQAVAMKAGANVDAGKVDSSLNVDQNNNYDGTLTFTPSVPGGTLTVTLNGLKDKATGATTLTRTLSAGANVIQVRGVPNGNPQYSVSYTFEYKVSGSGGYAPQVYLATTPGAQTIAVSGGPATGSATVNGAGSDPQPSSAYFSPTATSEIDQAYHNAGDTVCDTIIPGLQVNPDGTTNEWPTDSKGNYAPVIYTVDFYVTTTPIAAETDTVPEGATIYSTETVTIGGTTTNPVGSRVKVCATTPLNTDQATASGWYSQVIHVNRDAQTSAGVKAFMPDPYSWSSPFGTPSENSIVPPAMSSTARTTTGVTTLIGDTQVPSTGLGLPLGDDITATGNVDPSEGFYAVDRHYTFPNTVDENGDAIEPTEADIVAADTTLDYTSPQIPVTQAGTMENAASFHCSVVGVGVWVHTLYAPDGTVLNVSSASDKSQWTFCKQLLVVTQASKNGAGKAVDTSTLWGTIVGGDQMKWQLWEQVEGDDASKDKLIATTKLIGLPIGVVNGATVTSPEVTYDASLARVYFIEIAQDMDAKLYDIGKPRVASESIIRDAPVKPGPPPEAGSVPTTPAAPTPAPLSPSPVFAG